MKVYGIVKSQGDGDDYFSSFHNKLFVSKQRAEIERDNILKDIKYRYNQAIKCSICEYYSDYFFHKLKGLSNEEFKIKYDCSQFYFSDAEGENEVYCDNWCYNYDEHEPIINEYELVEE